MTTPNLSEPAGMSLSALFAEWRAELIAFVQEKFAGPLNEGTEYVGIAMDEHEIAVRLIDGERVFEVGRIARNDEHAARAISTALSTSERVPRGTTDVALQFASSQVLRPHLSLPMASASTLRKAAYFELERLSPVDPEQVYFDLVQLPGDRSKKKADIELRIVKRNTADAAVALCRAAGLSVGAIAFEEDAREVDRRYFPVDTRAFLRMRWRRFSVLLLAGLAGLLLLLVLLGAYWRGASQASYLSDQVDAASQRAAIVHHIKRDIRDTRAQIEFPAAQKRAPLQIAVLSELTRVMPDGTWLTEFTMNDDKVHIQGFSHSASDLIGVIDKSPMFSDAIFEASLQSAQDNAEHFDLSFKLRKQKKGARR